MNWKKFIVSESQKREKHSLSLDVVYSTHLERFQKSWNVPSPTHIPDFTTRHYFVDSYKTMNKMNL